jgi:hypothetical protein
MAPGQTCIIFGQLRPSKEQAARFRNRRNHRVNKQTGCCKLKATHNVIEGGRQPSHNGATECSPQTISDFERFREMVRHKIAEAQRFPREHICPTESKGEEMMQSDGVLAVGEMFLGLCLIQINTKPSVALGLRQSVETTSAIQTKLPVAKCLAAEQSYPQLAQCLPSTRSPRAPTCTIVDSIDWLHSVNRKGCHSR